MDTGRRAAIRVIHRHRIGRLVFARVSELVFRDARPLAVLSWTSFGAVRTPLVCFELDPARLRAGANRRIYLYADVTWDPRFPLAERQADP